jgi:hypothetical protein
MTQMSSKFNLLLLLVLLLAAGAIGIVRTTSNASAWHWFRAELWTMHNNYSEVFCAEVEDTSIGQSNFYTRVRNTLYMDNPAEDWDALAWDGNFYLIWWVGMGSTKCSQQQNLSDLGEVLHA